jgi:hypothetical protein
MMMKCSFAVAIATSLMTLTKCGSVIPLVKNDLKEE